MAKIRVRWVVEWQQLNLTGQRLKAEEADGGPFYEHDRDFHERDYYETAKTLEAARTIARAIVKSGVTLYGATVQEEHYLPIEGTVHYDWEPMGEPEQFD